MEAVVADYLKSPDVEAAVQSGLESEGDAPVDEDKAADVLAAIHRKAIQKEFPSFPELPAACVKAAMQDLPEGSFPLDKAGVSSLYSIAVKKMLHIQ